MEKNSNSLLISEPPLQVIPSLAKKIGLNEAIVLQQVHYWLENTKAKGKIVDGKKWIYNTYPEWKDNFPFWSERTIQRIFSNLEEMGLIISIQKRSYDREKYYRIDYDKMDTLNTTEDCDNFHHDNLAPSNTSSCRDGRRQNGIMEDDNLAPSLTETNPEINTDINEHKKSKVEPTYEACNDDGFEQKPLKAPTIKDSDRLLIDTFCDLTHIKYIQPVSSSDWKSFQVNWLKPLRKMQQLVGTTERAIEVMDNTINKMRVNNWQISTPKSLEKTFAAILGLANNQEDKYLGMTARGALYQKADGSQYYKNS